MWLSAVPETMPAAVTKDQAGTVLWLCLQGHIFPLAGSWGCDSAAAWQGNLRHGAAARQLSCGGVCAFWRGIAMFEA